MSSSAHPGTAGRIRLLVAALAVATAAVLVAYGTAATAGETVHRCLGEEATLVGTKDDDAGSKKLEGTADVDVIVGRGGNDEIDGKGGGDIICGDNGHDLIGGGRDDDRVAGENGDDLLLGGMGQDKLLGGDGGDLLGGGEGKPDVCKGGNGRDLAQKSTCEKIFGANPV